jgi:nitroreductase
MNTYDAIRTQRAVREFADRPLPAEALERVLDAGRRAPSSKNEQPWSFIIVHERSMLERLAQVGDYASHLAGATVAIAFITADHRNPERRVADAFDLGHAVQSMMLTAVDLGIGSVHASVYDQQLARRLLGYPEDHRCDYLISLGYPADADLLARPRHRPARRQLAELLHQEGWQRGKTG